MGTCRAALECVVLSCIFPCRGLPLWWHTNKQHGTQPVCSPEAQSP